MSLPYRSQWWTTTRKVALITFFTNLYFYTPFETLYFQSRGLDLLQISSLWGIIVGTMFVAEVPTGIVADKIGRRQALIISLFLQLAGEILFLFARGYAFFAVTSIVAGIGFSFASGAVDALVYDSLPADDRPAHMKRAMGLIGSSGRIGNIVAFSLGGLMVANLRTEPFIVAIGFTAAAVGLGLLWSFAIHEPKHEVAHSKPDSVALLRAGLHLLRRNGRLRRIVLLSLLTDAFGPYLLRYYQPYFLLAQIHVVVFGVALALGSLAGALGERYAYLVEKVLGMRRAVLLATALPGVLYLVMAGIIHPVGSVVLFVLQYGAMSIRGPLFSAYMNGHIESSHRATVLSLISMLSGIYVALMGLVIGRVADVWVPYAFVLMGTIVLAGAWFARVDERFVAGSARLATGHGAADRQKR